MYSRYFICTLYGCNSNECRQVLIEFSYESTDNSRHLVDYLNKRLQRPSPYGVLKTLKTIKHLVSRGSREFRKALRENDEHIKSGADRANHNSSYTGRDWSDLSGRQRLKEICVAGTEVMEQVRKYRTDILVELFNEDRLAEDSSAEPEEMPTSAVSSTGMGSFATGSPAGKYEGFGNSPINKSSVTDRVRDMMESVMNLPDPKQEIMKLCLEDPVGDYRPLVLPSQPVCRPRTVSSSKPSKPHTPG